MIDFESNHRRSKLIFLVVISMFLVFVFGMYVMNRPRDNYGDVAYNYLDRLVGKDGIGARPILSVKLDSTVEWIKAKLSDMGYQVFVERYDDDVIVADDRKFVHTELVNLWVEIPGLQSDDLIILSADYGTSDTNTKSRGAISNGSGVVTLLTVAEEISKQNLQLPYRTRFLFHPNRDGARYHSLNLVKNQNHYDYRVLGVVVLDSVIGGDKLYVHSPIHIPLPEKVSEYDSMDWIYRLGAYQDHNSDPIIRNSLLAHSTLIAKNNPDNYQLIKHAGFSNVPPGQIKDWSAIVAFYRLGIPSAHIESTNFDIISQQNYRDGDSQTTDSHFWSSGFCPEKMTACDTEDETNWGRIWRTDFDNLTVLQSYLPDRLRQQLHSLVMILLSFLQNPL